MPETTPLPPLLSDSELREIRDESENMITMGRSIREIYEADRSKLMALLQTVSNALDKAKQGISEEDWQGTCGCGGGRRVRKCACLNEHNVYMAEMDAAIASVKEHTGITPQPS